jgi:hypothetical protein
MIILLSQLFPPATLLASAILAPHNEPTAELVRARSSDLSLAPASSHLFDTMFGLRPMPEERPYAL